MKRGVWVVLFVILTLSVIAAEQGGIIDRSGRKMRLTEGQSADIIFEDRQYTITVHDVSETHVTVSVDNEKATIREGYNAVFDMGEGSKGGLMIEAVGLIGNDANLRLWKVEGTTREEPELVPFENETAEPVVVDEPPVKEAEEKNFIVQPLFIAVATFIGVIILLFLRDLRKRK